MKKQNVLFVIWFLTVTFAFSACQKSTTENAQTRYKPVILPTPDENLLIKEIDFNNFTYPDKKGRSIFRLINGEEPFGKMKDIAFKLENIQYADLTTDEEDEAVVHISVQYGADSSGILYIYTLENNKPKILWYVESGYGAEGGLKSAYTENNNLNVELFGDNKFIEAKGEFKFPDQKIVPKDLCCSTTYTKFRFRWNGEKFVVESKPELLWLKKPSKEN